MNDDNRVKMTKRLGARIRKLRENAGFSRRELSELTGISLAQIQKIEYGTTGNINYVFMCDIAQALNINIEDIIIE